MNSEICIFFLFRLKKKKYYLSLNHRIDILPQKANVAYNTVTRFVSMLFAVSTTII